MYSVSIIGSGNVAHRFSVSLNEAGHKIECVFSRDIEKAERLSRMLRRYRCNPAYTSDYDKIPNSDIIIIAVSDSAIPEVVSRLPLRDSLFLHTSGATPLSVFDVNRQRRFGVLYPLMTLSKSKSLDLKIVPFLIEASDKAGEKIIVDIVSSWKAEYKICTSSERLKMHAAAVFVTNFINYMLSLAYDISSPDFVFLLPAAVETVRKGFLMTPETMQTGPARRRDLKTMESHMELLRRGFPNEHLQVYELLSKLIMERYNTQEK